MGFQKAKRDLKAVYGRSDSESSDNKRRRVPAIDVISNSVVDTIALVGNAPRGPTINVVLKLVGRRCRTHRQLPRGAHH
jgi:hypothetical protein